MLPSVEAPAIYLGVREGQILISQYACNSFLLLSGCKYNKLHGHGAVICLWDRTGGRWVCRWSLHGRCLCALTCLHRQHWAAQVCLCSICTKCQLSSAPQEVLWELSLSFRKNISCIFIWIRHHLHLESIYSLASEVTAEVVITETLTCEGTVQRDDKKVIFQFWVYSREA